MKAKIWNHSEWIPLDGKHPEKLMRMFSQILHECDFTVLDVMEHSFKPQGYTLLFLLAESHLAIHTFPEENQFYVEMSSCNLDKQINFLLRMNAFQDRK